MRPLVAGNWKMNGLQAALGDLRMLSAWVGDSRPAADVLVCPPATLLAMASAAAGSGVAVGGQDCHARASGAHTGDIAAEMLKEAGASAVILGHSERRADHAETDGEVRGKVEAARRAGLLAIVCVGETEAERLADRAEAVVGAQLAGSLPDGITPENTVVAYEPVWAIGTGRTPTTEDIAAMHAFMAETLTARFGTNGAGVRLLYGGSVKASNAAEIAAIPHVHGALVGGASLRATDFIPIITAFAAG